IDAASPWPTNPSDADLTHLLSDQDPENRRRAVKELRSRMPNKPSAKALGMLLSDDDWLVRRYATDALIAYRSIAINSLIENLHKSGYSRSLAAQALADIGADSLPALPSLITTMRNGDIDTRRESTRAIGNLGPRAAIALPTLIQGLSDE